MGMARAALGQNVVSEPVMGGSNNLLPVPRGTMAPSRIAAIMLRRQFSGDKVRLISAVIRQSTKFNYLVELCFLCFVLWPF